MGVCGSILLPLLVVILMTCFLWILVVFSSKRYVKFIDGSAIKSKTSYYGTTSMSESSGNNTFLLVWLSDDSS